ncbi:MAG: hypothetical protein R2695_13645 [Acidimicrobiales bacterium]
MAHAFQLRSGDAWRSPWDDYRHLRDHDPVHRVDHPRMGEFWVLSRFADVFDAVRDTATFSSAEGLTPGENSASMFSDDARPIVMMDPPDHTAMRRLVSVALTPPGRSRPLEDRGVRRRPPRRRGGGGRLRHRRPVLQAAAQLRGLALPRRPA